MLLNQFIVATSDLKFKNKVVRSSTVGEVVGIVDRIEGSVLIEIYPEEISNFDGNKTYSSSFIKMAKIDLLKLKTKRAYEKSR